MNGWTENRWVERGMGVCPLVTPVDRMWHGAKYFMAMHSGACNWKWIPSERSHLHETQSLQILSCNLHVVQTSTLSKQKINKKLYRNRKVRVILHVSWRLSVKNEMFLYSLLQFQQDLSGHALLSEYLFVSLEQRNWKNCGGKKNNIHCSGVKERVKFSYSTAK